MFPEVIQCLPIPVLEIKKSELYALVSLHLHGQRLVIITDYNHIRSAPHCSGLPLPSQLRTCKTRPNRQVYSAF